MPGEQAFQFEWDEVKAASNLRKHAVTFELAATVFFDARILTVADLAHSEIEERWFAIGLASNGVMLPSYICGGSPRRDLRRSG